MVDEWFWSRWVVLEDLCAEESQIGTLVRDAESKRMEHRIEELWFR